MSGGAPPPSVLVPIPHDRQADRRWKVVVDGRETTQLTELTLSHPSYGTLTYGMAPRGYDTWAWREHGGGGVVVVPFVVVDGALHVGVVEQERHTQGGRVWNVPRGFRDEGESSEAAAARELREETRFTRGTPLPLGGAPANPNSAFFETPESGMGVAFFGVEVAREHIERRDGAWVFREAALDDDRRAQDEEHIAAFRFAPWTEVAALADMFSLSACARLLRRLEADGRIAVTTPG